MDLNYPLILTIMSLNVEEKFMNKYICTVCNYEYDPAENDNVRFEDLADDYVCPICGVGKDMFKKE